MVTTPIIIIIITKVTTPKKKKKSINSTLWYMNDNNGSNSHKIIIITTLVTTAASIISITSNKFLGNTQFSVTPNYVSNMIFEYAKCIWYFHWCTIIHSIVYASKIYCIGRPIGLRLLVTL